MPFGNHTLLLSLEGLLAFGHNDEGQLGLGDTKNRRVPTKVPWKGLRVVQVVCGKSFSLALDQNGGVWEAGKSIASESSNLTFQKAPDRVGVFPPIARLAAGPNLCAALDRDGHLWGRISDYNPPDLFGSHTSKLEGFPLLLKVACGYNYFVGEAREGGIWVVGANKTGQLGLGHTECVRQPTSVLVEGLSKGPLRCLDSLNHSVLLIDSEGTVWTAGSNEYGQLGRSGNEFVFQKLSNLPPMLLASCGSSYTLALDVEGGVWGWGRNYHSNLGTGDNSDRPRPTLITSLEGIRGRRAASGHSMARRIDGELLVFGNNYFGQLGLGRCREQILPTPSPVAPSLRPPVPVPRVKKSARSTKSGSSN